MAKIPTVNLPTASPSEQTLSQALFPKGTITLINPTGLPKDALSEATNAMLYENGSAGPRWGTDWFGTGLPGSGAIDGADKYLGADGTTHLWVVRGGVFYRSTNDGATWTACTGATFTVGYKVAGEQGNLDATNANILFLTNGQDPLTRYNGTTTLAVTTPIAAPTGLAATATAGLTSGTTPYTNYYRVTAVNNIGATVGSASAHVNTNVDRSSFDPTNTGTNHADLTWTAVTGAVRYDIYYTNNSADDAANNLFYLDSVGTPTTPGYRDNGQSTPNPSSQVPIQDTTSGPTLGELKFIGSRLVGTRDKNNIYRVWWTGSGPYLGYFSDSYDGGYIDLQKGSQYFPVHTEAFQDGKATPLITVWCDAADGTGCVWQMSLDSVNLQTSTYTQPNAHKLPGSRGTSAPYSVVNVLNDYMYFNYQAFFNLGPRAQFLNLLSTDEASGNIRTTLVNNINKSYGAKVCSAFYLAKVFFSVPQNSTDNSVVHIYDTERKAWMINAYNFGMERIFQYTDTTGKQHLLFWKPGDSRLSETSSSITGDYGKAFPVSITTGIMPVDKDRFAFMSIDDAEVEFANPQGSINVELLGTDRTNGFILQKTVTIKPATSQSNVGWSTQAWSTVPWSYTGKPATSYAEISSKRYFIVNKELNNYQFHITASSANAVFQLRLLELHGTLTDAGYPGYWRVNAH